MQMLDGAQYGRTFAMLTVHRLESSESLEVYCGRDRVRRCCLLTSLREGLEDDCGKDRVQRCRSFSRHSKRRSIPEIVLSSIFQNFASKMANFII